MRPITVLFMLLRALLLASAVLLCLLFLYLLSEQTVQDQVLFSSSTRTPTPPVLHTTERGSSEPRLDPAQLLNSHVMPKIDEEVRVAVFKRLSSKLAKFDNSKKLASSTPNTNSSLQNAAPTRKKEQHIVSHSVSKPPNHQRTPPSRQTSTDDSDLKEKPHMLRKEKAKPTTSQAVEGRSEGKAQHSSVEPLSIAPDYLWPQPHAVRPMRDLMTEQWMADLQSCVRRMPSHQLTLLTSNQAYTEVLPPLRITA